MRALVTGGAGFIGSHLVDRLVADGHEVTVADDLSTGRQEWVHPNARFLFGDAINLNLQPGEFEWIFHLAGRADVVPSIDDPVGYFMANVATTLALLEQARTKCSLARFIYAASSSCYGVDPPVPTNEDAPIKPAHPYALSKRLGEELVLHYGQVYKLPVMSLRLFNVYGPRARTSGAYGAVIGTFLAQRANGSPLTIVGNGTQQRDFVYVSDVVKAFVLSAMSPDIGVLNIGYGHAVSVNRLAKLIGGPVEHIPDRKGEPRTSHADIGLARIVLGWTPETTFEDGIAQLLDDMQPWKGSPVWTRDSIAKATATWHQYLG